MNRNVLYQPIALLSLPSAATSFLCCMAFILFCSLRAAAQTQQEVYQQRAAKIVTALKLSKKGKNEKLTKIIAAQYNQLNLVHDNAKKEIAELKQSGITGDTLKNAIEKVEAAKTAALGKYHRQYVKKLHRKLSATQADQVKDGMTYNVMNVTYAAYLDMILSLTAEEKQTIYNWLKEAREKAMDEGSSDDKHKVFGKYKGKINNYLSARGYDMKAEEKAWQQRLREKRTITAPEQTPRQNS